MTWDVPVKDNCPTCGQTLFKKSGRGFKKPFCINPERPDFLPEEKRAIEKKTTATAESPGERRPFRGGKDEKDRREKDDGQEGNGPQDGSQERDCQENGCEEDTGEKDGGQERDREEAGGEKGRCQESGRRELSPAFARSAGAVGPTGRLTGWIRQKEREL